jgi:hypothetical protein
MLKQSTVIDGAQSWGGTLLKSLGIVIAVRTAEFVVDQAIGFGRKLFGKAAASGLTPKGKADKAKPPEAEAKETKPPADGKRKGRKEPQAKESATPSPAQPQAAAK